METKSPYLFPTYSTRESVPPQLRVFLITPYDPNQMQKYWADPREESAIPVDEDGIAEYRVFRKNENGNYDWDDVAKRPRFRRILVDPHFAVRLNIPPKDFTGKVQEITGLPELLPPVQTDPPEGYEWGLSLGITPTFFKTATKPVTLEDIYAAIQALRNEIKSK